ncbi:hypothetical protein ES332_A06G124900v1 [Gossypium tomentosum]|uniref:Uncharacterized protein n=1 Tax=Gossypium tomentosum TaxID=34277 RepID=A0A5D2Q3I4_GOSTO|nr:hypothetical protein ES332_A06G124900v1 [Gossypium tomentosum]
MLDQQLDRNPSLINLFFFQILKNLPSSIATLLSRCFFSPWFPNLSEQLSPSALSLYDHFSPFLQHIQKSHFSSSFDPLSSNLL